MGSVVLIALILLGIKLVKLYLNRYHIRPNFSNLFVGSQGTGKTLIGTKQAIKLHRKALFNVRMYNLLHPFKEKLPTPYLYSSIPLNYRYYKELTARHLLMLDKINDNSIVFIDEVGQVVSKHAWKKKYVNQTIQEFVRLARHYYGKKWGAIIYTEQSLEDVEVDIRRRCGISMNLNSMRKWFGILYYVDVYEIVCIDGVANTSSVNQSDHKNNYLFGFFPLKKLYDTFCYSENYPCISKPNDIASDIIEHMKSKGLIDLEKCYQENADCISIREYS